MSRREVTSTNQNNFKDVGTLYTRAQKRIVVFHVDAENCIALKSDFCETFSLHSDIYGNAQQFHISLGENINVLDFSQTRVLTFDRWTFTSRCVG